MKKVKKQTKNQKQFKREEKKGTSKASSRMG